VLVTGSTREGESRGTTYARDVVDGATIAARADGSLAGVLDAVPGVWLWAPSPSSLVSRWGSLRGASSFGASAPKIYLDGVEVANPMLVTGLVPEAIERVEIVRGPQGAALRGADAIGGVIDIVTRRGGADDGPRLLVRSDAGPSRSEFSGAAVLAQRHALAARGGSGARTGGISLSLGTLGDYVPGGASREIAAHADGRVVGSLGVLALTARVLDKAAGVTRVHTADAPAGATGVAEGPVLVRRLTAAGDSAQTMRQFTLGATATLADVGRWTPRATVGVDGYRLSDAAAPNVRLLSAADSALHAARGGADRVTMRVSGVGRFGRPGARSATVTLAAEHTELREATSYEVPLANGSASVVEQAWRNSTGVVAQARVALRDRLFLDAGLRLERDAGYGAGTGLAALPMLGAAAVRDVLGAAVKVRAAYGRAIRPPRAGLRDAFASLGAEAQAGVEAGVDVALGDPARRGVAVRVTRYDQRASGLLQSVTLADALADPRAGVATYTGAYAALGLPTPRRLARLNAGEIANRGWELQGSARRGRLAVAGTLSLVDSRVARVADAGAVGDVRVGDRTLDVPARTASLSATWTAARWSATWGVARAADWVGYDRTALARAAATDPSIGGADLRAFLRAYDGVTRLRASATRDLTRGLALTAAGDNLLDRQRGEPDDVTVVPGRTVTLGLRASF
jgi:iron complex outermembrane receptor protein